MWHPRPSETPFEISSHCSSPGFKYSYYRIIVSNTSTVKYLASPDPATSFPDTRGEGLGFKAVPDGDWNLGHLVREAGEDQYWLKAVAKTTLAGVEKIWHPRKIDCSAFGKCESNKFEIELQSTGQICSVVYSNYLGADKVIVNMNWHPESVYGVNHETEIYSLIHDHDIGPRFLAHVTENHDRVIGYMVEKVPARRATIDDLPACRKVLSELHNLGIAHGSLRITDFLVTGDCTLLHNFGGAYKTNDHLVLKAEMDSLERLLQTVEQPHQFKTLTMELGDAIRAISLRDNGLHPLLWDQAFADGAITVSPSEHMQMLHDLRKHGWKRLVNV